MKRASVPLRIAAFFCACAILFLVARMVSTHSFRELKESFLQDPVHLVAFFVLTFFVALPASLYVLSTGKYPDWADRLLGVKDTKFAKDRKELILKILYYVVFYGGLGGIAFCFWYYLEK